MRHEGNFSAGVCSSQVGSRTEALGLRCWNQHPENAPLSSATFHFPPLDTFRAVPTAGGMGWEVK